MLAGIKCLPCIVDDLVGALDVIEINDNVKMEIIKKSSEYLSKNFSLNEIPSKFITQVHRILKKESGINLPFAEMRQNSNLLGKKIAENIEKSSRKINSEEEKLHRILKWCVAGNHLDFRTAGKGYGFSAKRTTDELRKIAERKFNLDESKKFYKFLKRIERILYIHDNVGEIALDGLLIKFLKKKGKRVISALRGGPITSDATISDGIVVGIDKIADSIIPAGPDTLGISWEEMSEELKEELKRADLIVSKGQANYYLLSEHLKELPAVLFLLTTKCDYVSSIFGFIGKGSVIKLQLKEESYARTSTYPSGTAL